MHKKLSFLYLLLAFCAQLYGQIEPEPKQELPLTRILFVFDASQSMYGRWQTGSKIDVAQNLMARMLDSLNSLPNKPFQLALRVYGHQKPVPPQDCDDTRLEVGFAPNNLGRIKQVIKGLQPKGTTPIARSLLKAATDFPNCDNCRNIIVLITDGIEACDEDPCAASRLLQKKGIILKPFVIGIGLDDGLKKSFDCVGQYFDAADEKTFQKVLDVVISQALDNTTAQVNLLDLAGNATETDVAMTFFNRVSGKAVYNFVHTLNLKGLPDTLILDPLINYRLQVHTIPPVSLDSIQLSAGRHNHIGLSTPRGTLEIKQPGGRALTQISCIVRNPRTCQTLNIQPINTAQKYLVGEYEVEILTLPRYVERIRIDQVKTTSLAIPPPGKLSLQGASPGFGSLFVENGNQLEWVVDLMPDQMKYNYELQPGNYRIIYRPKRSQSTHYSISKSFNISSGGSTVVKLK